MTNDNNKFDLYIFGLVFIVLIGSYSWFQFYISPSVKCIIVLISLLWFTANYKNRIPLNKYSIVLYLLYCSSAFFERCDLYHIVVKCIMGLPILSFFTISKIDQKKILYILNHIMSLLIGFGLFLWIFSSLGIPILNFGTYTLLQYNYENQLFNINVSGYDGAFSAFCIEPGYFSYLCVCLLIISDFDFNKKSTYLYIISIIASFSLGGFILGIIAYFMKRTLEQEYFYKSLLVFLSLSFFLVILVIISYNYNGGNNIFVTEILSRLEYDEDLGIVGNNRENAISSLIVDSYFFSNKIWFGIGEQALADALSEADTSMCSWRGFVVSRGAIYSILFFVFFNWYYISKCSKKKSLLVLTIFWLDFIQHGNMFSEAFYIFVLYLNAYTNTDSNVISKRSKKIAI